MVLQRFPDSWIVKTHFAFVLCLIFLTSKTAFLHFVGKFYPLNCCLYVCQGWDLYRIQSLQRYVSRHRFESCVQCQIGPYLNMCCDCNIFSQNLYVSYIVRIIIMLFCSPSINVPTDNPMFASFASLINRQNEKKIHSRQKPSGHDNLVNFIMTQQQISRN